MRQLQAASRRFTANLIPHTGLIPLGEPIVHPDIDSKAKQVHGPAKQGASLGYTKVRGPHFQIVSAPTASPRPMVIATRPRKGPAGPGNGAHPPVAAAIRAPHEAGAGATVPASRGLGVLLRQGHRRDHPQDPGQHPGPDRFLRSANPAAPARAPAPGRPLHHPADKDRPPPGTPLNQKKPARTTTTRTQENPDRTATRRTLPPARPRTPRNNLSRPANPHTDTSPVDPGSERIAWERPTRAADRDKASSMPRRRAAAQRLISYGPCGAGSRR